MAFSGSLLFQDLLADPLESGQALNQLTVISRRHRIDQIGAHDGFYDLSVCRDRILRRFLA